jgi:AraC-like DNA-binding protein
MLQQDYLNLRLIRLKSPQEWAIKGPGFSLLFPKGGVGTYDSGVNARQFMPGDVLVVNAARGGKVCVANRGEVVFWCFNLCFEHLYPLFASNEICLFRSVIDGFIEAKLYPASDALARECYRLLADVAPQFSLDHRSQLLRVAAAILAAEFTNMRRQRGGFVRIEDHMINVFESLTSADILKMPVGDLASKFSCSRRHLSRLFHQHFGLSVAALKMEMRLLKAMSLLKDPDTKVINVASECGFNHLGLFNTCFKRRFGASPGQWRKTQGQVTRKSVEPALLDGDPNCALRTNGLCPWSVKSDHPNPLVREALPIQTAGFSSRQTHPPSRDLIAGAQRKPAALDSHN